MSRTFRHRSTVPHGWKVRDGGKLCPVDGRSAQAHRVCSIAGIPALRFRRCPCLKEPKAFRKQHGRAYRARCRHLMRQARYDDLLPYRHTEGRLWW